VSIVYIFIAILIEILTIFLAYSSSNIFKVSSDLENTLLIVIMIVGGNLALGFIFKTFSGIIVALRRFDTQNTIMIITSICRTLCIIIFLKYGFGLIAMAMIVLLFDTVTSVLFIFSAYKLFPQLTISLGNFSTILVKQLYTFTGYTFLIHFSRIVSERSGLVLIGMFLGTEFIVYYALAESLVTYARKLPKGIVTTILPFSSHLDAKGDTKNLNRMLYVLPKYMIMFTFFVFFVFVEFGKEGVMFWMGSGYDDCYPLLVILIGSEIILQATNVVGQIFVGMGRNRAYALLSVFGTVMQVLLSIIFMKLWGVIGIALGTFTSILVSRGILLPAILAKTGIFSISIFFQKSLLPPLISFGLFYLCYFLLSNIITIPKNILLGFIASIFVSSVFYLALSYKIVLREIVIKGKKISFQD
jgi:O-antigen/teichoic acid export membrane protein